MNLYFSAIENIFGKLIDKSLKGGQRLFIILNTWLDNKPSLISVIRFIKLHGVLLACEIFNLN